MTKNLGLKTFKIEIAKGGPNNSDLLQNWFSSEIRSPLFNLQKFQKSEKGTPESSRMHWNLMNDKHFEFLKLLKLKYRRGDQIIPVFFRGVLENWFLPRNQAPLFNLRKFYIREENVAKLLLNDAHKIYWNLTTQMAKKTYLLDHAECIEMRWCGTCVLQIFKIEIYIQLFCKIGFPPHPRKLGPLLNLRQFQKTGEK